MKLLICGDSWTAGYGVNPDQAWPNLLGKEFNNTSTWGASNQCIRDHFLDNYDNSYDAVIIGWSGVTRFWRDKLHDFSSVDNIALDYYKNKSLNDILVNWDDSIKAILETSKVPVIQFSVFGDIPLIKYKNFLEKSYLEFLANAGGIYFKYHIPIFEFDWLNEDNLKLTEPFGKKYFPATWKRACVERENIRNSNYFLGCGHPTAEGHKLWAQHIKGVLDDIFSK